MDTKRILVVEDERDVATLIQARLEAGGYAVHVEERGDRALVEARLNRPDLVILDLMLPDMDGYAVSTRLRGIYHSSTLPIVMLTSRDQPRDKLRGYAAGADAYLTKPYEARELLKMVGELLGNRAA